MYEVMPIKNGRFRCYITIQVNLEQSAVQKLTDQMGLVTKADFIKLGQDMKLMDFGGAMEDKRKPQSPRMERRMSNPQSPRSERRSSKGREEEKVSEEDENGHSSFFSVSVAPNQPLLDVLLSSRQHAQPSGGESGQGDEGLHDLGYRWRRVP